jgi:hypothetical protein
MYDDGLSLWGLVFILSSHHCLDFFSFVTLSFLVNSSVPIQLIKSFLTFKDFRTSWFQLRVVRFSVKIALLEGLHINKVTNT